MRTFGDERFLRLADRRYGLQDARGLRAFLTQQGTFEFPVLETGLFPAARLADEAQYTGYDNVWVRDNVCVAHAHFVHGHAAVAVRTVQALQRYFERHSHRFQAIIRGEADANEPMNRPHVRFNGRTLAENPEKWSHAQNDALGFFLWLYCKLATAGHLNSVHWDLLALFPLYFRAIGYWQDEDSGYWEEARKIEASSIGTVVAGLEAMKALMAAQSVSSLPPSAYSSEAVTGPVLEELIENGRAALSQILPSECVQPAKKRSVDAALLFLIYPLQVVGSDDADSILSRVETELKGDYGIRRYLGDSFWCADYKALQSPERRTADVSDDMSARNALLKPRQEAQWCLFDPLLSTIYGRRYAAAGNEADLDRQVHYLNRSLNQLTQGDSGFPPFLCPELYYREGGRYVPNDVTPLLWTQANFSVALNHMEHVFEQARPVSNAIREN